MPNILLLFSQHMKKGHLNGTSHKEFEAGVIPFSKL
jgi:hypothetical protein